MPINLCTLTQTYYLSPAYAKTTLPQTADWASGLNRNFDFSCFSGLQFGLSGLPYFSFTFILLRCHNLYSSMYSSSSKRVPFNIRVKRRYCHASGSVGVTGCIFLAWLMSYYLMVKSSEDQYMYTSVPAKHGRLIERLVKHRLEQKSWQSRYTCSFLSKRGKQEAKDDWVVYPRLPDIGFDLLPHLDQLWLTDLFDALLVLPTIVLVTTHRRPMHGKYIYTSWMSRYKEWWWGDEQRRM